MELNLHNGLELRISTIETLYIYVLLYISLMFLQAFYGQHFAKLSY